MRDQTRLLVMVDGQIIKECRLISSSILEFVISDNVFPKNLHLFCIIWNLAGKFLLKKRLNLKIFRNMNIKKNILP